MALNDALDIVNDAFDLIAEDPISDLENGTSRRAKMARRQYPIKRKALLREANWKFAITRVTLDTPDATDPEFGFGNRFELPADCLRFLGLYDSNEPLVNYTSTKMPHKIEGEFLLVDQDSADIFYIKDEDDPANFDALFAELLSLDLAMKMAYGLSTGQRRVNTFEKQRPRLLRRARIANAIEGKPELIQASEWIDARYEGLGRWYRPGPIS